MRSSVVQSIQNLKLSLEFMNDFIRTAPNTKGAVLFKTYTNKIEWIFKDILTYPHFNDEVRKGIRAEIESDSFTVEAIHDKIPLLNPEQRAMLEGLVEDMIAGKSIEIKIKNQIVHDNEMIEEK
ncbi:MAG: hypothetical protein ACOVNU_02815 [Candidatus Kapaibacteriota bacterium]